MFVSPPLMVELLVVEEVETSHLLGEVSMVIDPFPQHWLGQGR